MKKKQKFPEVKVADTTNAVICDCNLFPYLIEGVSQGYAINNMELPQELVVTWAIGWVSTQMRVLLQGGEPHDAWGEFDESLLGMMKRMVNAIVKHYRLPVGNDYQYRIEPIHGPSLCIVYNFKGVLQ
jgi:hypothetical protein